MSTESSSNEDGKDGSEASLDESASIDDISKEKKKKDDND